MNEWFCCELTDYNDEYDYDYNDYGYDYDGGDGGDGDIIDGGSDDHRFFVHMHRQT